MSVNLSAKSKRLKSNPSVAASTRSFDLRLNNQTASVHTIDTSNSSYLRDKVLLELGEELQVEQVVGRQRLLTHDGLHRLHVLADGVTRVL